jgi:hypothetical protein
MANSPSVIAFAGRRVDANGAEEKRFPFEKVQAVKAAVKAYIVKEKAIALVSSGACGADLIAILAATSIRPRVVRTRIVLPFSPKKFKQTSVLDRPHPEFWGRLFDDAVTRSAERADLVVLDKAGEGESASYTAANKAILVEAKKIAGRLSPPARRIALLAWEGGPHDGDDTTKQFADLSVTAGFLVQWISTIDPGAPHSYAHSPRS